MAPKKSGFQIRRVANKEDRKRPSVFMRLKVDEAFKGIALFEPDPELDDNPGYFEYYDHFDKQGNSYVPCAGDKCPFCAANDNPSTRALTAWYFPEAADVKDRIKVFTMNYSTTQDITDESEDEDGIIGKVIRIKRLEPAEKGNYKVKVTNDKDLTKAQLTAAMKLLNEKFPDGLVALVERQLQVQMERLKALDALDDDDDDDEDTTPTPSKRGKAVDEDEDEDTAEDEDADEEAPSEIEEAELEIVSVLKSKNSIKVEWEGETITLVGDGDGDFDLADFRKGDTAIVSAEYDEDEETWALTALEQAEEEAEEEEADEDEEEEDEDAEIKGAIYEVVRVMEKDEVLDLQDDDGKVKMWVGTGVDPDYDEITKGKEVVVSAVKDDEDDWIITEIALATAKKKPTARSRAAKK